MPEHCGLVDRATFIAAYSGDDNKDKITAKALAGALTIYDKGWGCASCTKFEYPTAAAVAAGAAEIVNPPFAYLNILGYTSIPDHLVFQREDLYLERRCSAPNTIDIGTGLVAGKVFFN